jgi:hypothetical protein
MVSVQTDSNCLHDFHFFFRGFMYILSKDLFNFYFKASLLTIKCNLESVCSQSYVLNKYLHISVSLHSHWPVLGIGGLE